MGVAGIGLVVAGDHQRREGEELELVEPVERRRARALAERPRARVEVAMAAEALAGDPRDGLAPALLELRVVVDPDELLDAAPLERVREAVPVGKRLGAQRGSQR